jgi:hypothetical protein
VVTRGVTDELNGNLTTSALVGYSPPAQTVNDRPYYGFAIFRREPVYGALLHMRGGLEAGTLAA